MVLAAMKSGVVPNRPRPIYDDGASRVYEASDGHTTLYVTADKDGARPLVKRTDKLWKAIETRMTGLENALNKAYPDGLPGKSSNLRSNVLAALLVAEKHYDGLHNQLDHGRKKKHYQAGDASPKDLDLWRSAPTKLGSPAWYAQTISASMFGEAYKDKKKVSAIRDESGKAQAMYYLFTTDDSAEAVDYFTGFGYPHLPDLSVGRVSVLKDCAVAPWQLDGVEDMDGSPVRGWGATAIYQAISDALADDVRAFYLISAFDGSHPFYEAIHMRPFGPEVDTQRGYGFSRPDMENYVRQYEAKYGKPERA